MNKPNLNSLIPFILIVQTCGFQKNNNGNSVSPDQDMSNPESVNAEDPPNDQTE